MFLLYTRQGMQTATWQRTACIYHKRFVIHWILFLCSASCCRAADNSRCLSAVERCRIAICLLSSEVMAIALSELVWFRSHFRLRNTITHVYLPSVYKDGTEDNSRQKSTERAKKIFEPEHDRKKWAMKDEVKQRVRSPFTVQTKPWVLDFVWEGVGL